MLCQPVDYRANCGAGGFGLDFLEYDEGLGQSQFVGTSHAEKIEDVFVFGLCDFQSCMGHEVPHRLVLAENVEFIYQDETWKLSQSWACTLITNTVAPEQVPQMCLDFSQTPEAEPAA